VAISSSSFDSLSSSVPTRLSRSSSLFTTPSRTATTRKGASSRSGPYVQDQVVVPSSDQLVTASSPKTASLVDSKFLLLASSPLEGLASMFSMGSSLSPLSPGRAKLSGSLISVGDITNQVRNRRTGIRKVIKAELLPTASSSALK